MTPEELAEFVVLSLKYGGKVPTLEQCKEAFGGILGAMRASWELKDAGDWDMLCSLLTVRDVLYAVRKRGLEIVMVNGQPSIRGSDRGGLTGPLLVALKCWKREIIDELSRGEP